MPTTTTLARFIADHGIAADVEHAASNPHATGDEWERSASHWVVTLKREGAEPFPVPFSQGSAHTEPPTADDVLDCLASDAASVENAPDWLDWAEGMGFDGEGAKALREARDTHATILKQSETLRSFLPEGAYDALLWNTDRL